MLMFTVPSPDGVRSKRTNWVEFSCLHIQRAGNLTKFGIFPDLVILVEKRNLSLYSGREGMEKMILKDGFDQLSIVMLTNSLACSASVAFAFGVGGVLGCAALRKDGNHKLEVEGALLDAMFSARSRGKVNWLLLVFLISVFAREVVDCLLLV